MLAFLQRILWDESAAERYGRSLLGALGAAYMSLGRLPATRAEWTGFASVALAFLVGAGDKNKPA